ncbi:hypothetical protein GH721_12680 [Kriegella sp. EG-1]|nr:hypothetical protein [Flavobacteriaceae bacterium EG-1]
MKTTMKLFAYSLILFSLAITSCSKDGVDGAVGPAGTAGTAGTNGIDGIDGTDGADGEDGTDGNADVQLLEYESETITNGTVTYAMQGISLSDIDENLILGFYANIYQTPNAGNSFITKKQWIPVPGRGANGLFESRMAVDGSSAILSGGPSSDFKVTLYQLGSQIAYTTEVTFDEFKIFIIPPSSIVSGNNNSSGVSNKHNIDFNKMTYEELIAHFEFEE